MLANVYFVGKRLEIINLSRGVTNGGPWWMGGKFPPPPPTHTHKWEGRQKGESKLGGARKEEEEGEGRREKRRGKEKTQERGKER